MRPGGGTSSAACATTFNRRLGHPQPPWPHRQPGFTPDPTRLASKSTATRTEYNRGGRWVRDLAARATSPPLVPPAPLAYGAPAKAGQGGRAGHVRLHGGAAPPAPGAVHGQYSHQGRPPARGRDRDLRRQERGPAADGGVPAHRRDADPRQHPAPHRYHDARTPAGPARGRDRHGRPREARRQRRAGALAPGPPDRQHEGPLRAGETDARLHPGAGPAARPHGAGDRLAPRRLRHRHAAGGPAHRRAHPPRRPGRARRRRHPRARARAPARGRDQAALRLGGGDRESDDGGDAGRRRDGDSQRRARAGDSPISLSA